MFILLAIFVPILLLDMVILGALRIQIIASLGQRLGSFGIERADTLVLGDALAWKLFNAGRERFELLEWKRIRIFFFLWMAMYAIAILLLVAAVILH